MVVLSEGGEVVMMVGARREYGAALASEGKGAHE